MFDELIQKIKELIPQARSNQQYYTSSVLAEAADAIEELSKYADTIRKLKHEGWYLQQTKYHDGYHAIATMPFPEPPKEG